MAERGGADVGVFDARGVQPSDEDRDLETQDMTGVKIYENHGQDSRVKDCGQVSPTIHRKTGTGGNNVPIVLKMEDVK